MVQLDHHDTCKYLFEFPDHAGEYKIPNAVVAFDILLSVAINWFIFPENQFVFVHVLLETNTQSVTQWQTTTNCTKKKKYQKKKVHTFFF